MIGISILIKNVVKYSSITIRQLDDCHLNSIFWLKMSPNTVKTNKQLN